ncbi:MAG: hypothetical protein JSS83_05470 [Cyanobacteria bacterium SZAS LIN-3]|nr:hypothetical protein [Cyanobacteria bacterium SZAS LIN-3]
MCSVRRRKTIRPGNIKSFARRLKLTALLLGSLTCTALPQTFAQSTAETPTNKPYFVRANRAAGEKEFDFPTNIMIGEINSGNLKLVKAYGKMRFRMSGPLNFRPHRILLNRPEYLKRFSPGDIDNVELDSSNGTPQMLELMSRMPALKSLSFYHCDQLDAASLKILKNYPALQWVLFEKCAFNADDFARQTDLNKFVLLSCAWETKTDQLLEALSRTNRLRMLFLNYSTVTHRGFESLAKLTSLENLNLTDAHFDRRDLKLLTKLPKLTSLDLTGCRIDAETLEVLKRIKSLKIIVLSPRNFLHLEPAAVKEALKHLTVLQESTVVPQNP